MGENFPGDKVMAYEFTSRQRDLIEKVCGASNLAPRHLAEKVFAGSLSFDEIEQICDLISNEMMQNGIDENFESNNYGRELELLLDIINGPRLRS